MEQSQIPLVSMKWEKVNKHYVCAKVSKWRVHAGADYRYLFDPG